MKANKGEWSEFYAFLKILEDKRLFAADENLDIVADKFFIFKKVIREEVNAETKIFDLTKPDICILNTEGKILKRISSQTLKSKTVSIFEKIKNTTGAAFVLPEAQTLMEELLCTQIKADSSKKSDLNGVIDDRISNKEERLGFSIKSMVGGASTLLNAGNTTNFIFKITGFDVCKIETINSIEGRTKIQDRLKGIVDNGGTLHFDKVLKDTFLMNLRKIDTALPIFLAQMLQDFFLGKVNKISDLVGMLGNNERLRESFNLSKSDYEYKIKSFLETAALGMVPSKVWDGFTKAHGGYIVVKSNGEVVCYHLYNRDEFLTYLYKNTKFESASSTRHNYGKIYQKEGEIYFNLNLQIRFIK